MAEGWLTGWKDIAVYMGRSIQTCKNLKRHNSLPIKYPPGGTPTALRYELDQWLINFHNIKTEQSK
jgi:hypothetical protein